MSNRYIATWTTPTGHEHTIEFACNLEDAKAIAAKRLGTRCDGEWKIWTDATAVSVALETDTHNIPALEPERWAELQARIAEMERRRHAA